MNSKRIFQSLLVIAIALFVIGNLFRIMHWPNGPALIMLAYVLVLVVYPRTVLLKKKRTYLDIIAVLAIFIWGGCGIAYMIYLPERLPILSAFSKVGLIGWIGVSIYNQFFYNHAETDTKTNFENAGYLLGIVLIAIGFFFKMMHWPGSGNILVIGAVISALIFFYSAFIKPDK